MKKNFFNFQTPDAKGQLVDLNQYKGKLILVVNVASKCGFTSQYKGLEELYKSFAEKGLLVLGFPCNQFGEQEPGTNQEIQQFCELNYGVSFPVLGKVDVNGPEASPVFEFLKSEAPGVLGTELIKWNFTKFLVGRDGQVIERFAPQTKPEELKTQIEAELSRS